MSDSIFGSGDPSQFTNSMLDPRVQALLGMAGSLATNAMPSRLPVPTGAVLAQAAQGMGTGVKNSLDLQRSQMDNQSSALDLQMKRAMMPAQIGLFNGAMGTGGGAPFGVPAAGGAPAASGSDGSGNLLPPAQLLAMGRYALVTKNDAAAAKLFGLINEQAGGTGYYVDNQGNAHPTLGGPQDPAVLQRDAAATAWGGVAPKLAGEGFSFTPNGVAPLPGYDAAKAAQAAAVAQGTARGAGAVNTKTITVYDANGVPHEQTMTENQAADAAAANPGGSGGAVPAALTAIPAPLQMTAVRSMLRANLPPAAWPSFIGMVQHESGWNPAVPTGPAGDTGLGQVIPSTGAMFGVTPQQLADPETNLTTAARYYAQQWQKAAGDPAKALAGYNTGDVTKADPGYVNDVMTHMQQWGAGGGAPGIPGAPKFLPGQQSEMEAQGKDAPDLEKGVRGDAREAQNSELRLAQAQAAMAAATKGGIPPGYFSPELAEAAAGAKSLGIDLSALGIDPKAVTNAQAAREAMVQISGEMMKRLFPQRITNMDIKLVGESLPNYGIDPGAIGQVLGLVHQQNQYDLNKAQFLENWKVQHGNSSVGWEPSFYLKNGYGPDPINALKAAGVGAAPAAASPAQSASAPLRAVHPDGRVALLIDGKWVIQNGK